MPVDPVALLASALGLFASGYAFDSTVSVGDQEAAGISGAVIADSAQMTVTSADGVAEYVTTPGAAWIRVEGGEWQELETAGPFAPPLANLASPNAMTVAETSTDGVVLVATYGGSNFGTEADVEMRLVFVDGFLTAASYATAEAVVNTSFHPLSDQVIEVPAPGA